MWHKKWSTPAQFLIHYLSCIKQQNKTGDEQLDQWLTADYIISEKWLMIQNILTSPIDFNIWKTMKVKQVYHSQKQSQICEQIMSSNIILFCGSAILTKATWKIGQRNKLILFHMIHLTVLPVSD